MSVRLQKCFVNDLALGMYVEQLDRPWTNTPLPFQGFYIRSVDELQQIRDCCEYVYVDNGKRDPSVTYTQLRATATKKSFVSECLDHNISRPTEPPAMVQSPVRVGARVRAFTARILGKAKFSDSDKRIRSDPESAPTPQARLKQSVARAENTHVKAAKIMTNVFEKCRAGGTLDVHSVEQVVAPIIDTVLDSPDAMACVVRMRNKDEYTYNHALATAVWSVVFGKFLGFDLDNLHALGLGALLLDIGKTKIPDQILNKSEPLTEDELQQIRRHVEYGLDMLEASGPVDARVTNMLETHHERHDGSGYPHGLRENEIPVFGRIAGIVDSYDAMTSLRPYAPAKSTYHAMRHLLDQSDELFQAEMVERFIQVVGIFPTATLVEMNTGEVGIVVEQNHVRRLRPKVMMVLDAKKNILEEFPIIDLAEMPKEQDAENGVWILRGLETGSYGIDPAEYYL